MIILNDPSRITTIPDPHIRRLVEQRYTELSPMTGCMVVVEPGDTVAALEQAIECPILSNLIDEVAYGEPDFAPSFDVVEDHGSCYEMVFVFGDEGITLFIPKTGVDVTLLALCADYAQSTQYGC